MNSRQVFIIKRWYVYTLSGMISGKAYQIPENTIKSFMKKGKLAENLRTAALGLHTLDVYITVTHCTLNILWHEIIWYLLV